MPVELTVSGIGWRPSFLPLIVLSWNNLNPAAKLSDAGISVKVIRTTMLPWESIKHAVVRKGLITTYCEISSGNSDYILHFWDRSDLGVLVRELRNRGIAVEVPKKIENDL